VLRQFRESLDVSQEKFAYEHDFDRSVVGAIERGERNIAFGSLKELLIAYGVSWTEFGRAMQRRDPLPRKPRRRR
jgi:transcriptional regulator with XRE-family HTH domain